MLSNTYSAIRPASKSTGDDDSLCYLPANRTAYNPNERRRGSSPINVSRTNQTKNEAKRMSQPLFGCTVAKAIQGDGESYNTLLHRLRQPCFTFMPCGHTPRCRPAEELVESFMEKFIENHPREAMKLASMGDKPVAHRKAVAPPVPAPRHHKRQFSRR